MNAVRIGRNVALGALSGLGVYVATVEEPRPVVALLYAICGVVVFSLFSEKDV